MFNPDELYVEVKSSGTVNAIRRQSKRYPYIHQQKAMEALNRIDRLESYSTLLVLPTGGGKTFTIARWLLSNAINKHKKVLWLAHRTMLLDQAAETFQRYAYEDVLTKVASFTYRIVSGSPSHDRTIDITPCDDLLIASKDSIGKNLSALDKWLVDTTQDMFLIIDEAHHATAKTYRRIIDYLKEKITNLKIIGLTATPFRTSENEQGLLAKIFTDGVRDNMPVQGDLGIAYQIGLKELINQQILSKPIFESCESELDVGEYMGVDDWKRIANLDQLPDKIATELADSKERNALIVKTYLEHRKKYGQTLIFAVNINHAIALNALFQKAGIKSAFIVSGIRDMATGINLSHREIDERIQQYRKKELQVLINVNILTEGTDLPETKTVFLARPTVSTILMTQMIGRALRGTGAGGTDVAYIVSFIDNWHEHIAWVNPETIFGIEQGEFATNSQTSRKNMLHLVAISLIEQFAQILDTTVDTDELEKIPFERRIPVGMYAFTYLDREEMEHTNQILIYDNTQEAYKEMLQELPELFQLYGMENTEYPEENILKKMAYACEEHFFQGEMLPPYEEADIINVLRYFSQKGTVPQFYTFADINLERLNISQIARHIWDNNLGARDKAVYLNELWENADDNLIRMFFIKKMHFFNQVDVALNNISGYYDEPAENVVHIKKYADSMPLFEIRKHWPKYGKFLYDGAFRSALTKNGEYMCCQCGFTSAKKIFFQVDHVIPINKGGKSRPENLQLLCRTCNLVKGDK